MLPEELPDRLAEMFDNMFAEVQVSILLARVWTRVCDACTRVTVFYIQK